MNGWRGYENVQLEQNFSCVAALLGIMPHNISVISDYYQGQPLRSGGKSESTNTEFTSN